MELASSSVAGKWAVDRSLLSDFWRACVAVLFGILLGLILAILLDHPHLFIELGALVAGPTLFVVFLLNFKRRARGLALARTLGSLAGWLAFVALYSNEGFIRPIYALRSTGLVLALFSAIALPLIAVALAASGYLWSKVRPAGAL